MRQQRGRPPALNLILSRGRQAFSEAWGSAGGVLAGVPLQNRNKTGWGEGSHTQRVILSPSQTFQKGSVSYQRFTILAARCSRAHLGQSLRSTRFPVASSLRLVTYSR
jgi:hypothetical protein